MIPTKKHYEPVGLLIPDDAIESWEADTCWGEAVSYTLTFTQAEYKHKPGKKLQALIDLGYTETEGVKMLDALGEETRG